MSSLLLSFPETNRLGPYLFPLLSTKRTFHQHPESSIIVSRINHSFRYCHRHSRRRSTQVQGRKIKVWPDVFVQNQVENKSDGKIFDCASGILSTRIGLLNIHKLTGAHPFIQLLHSFSFQTSYFNNHQSSSITPNFPKSKSDKSIKHGEALQNIPYQFQPRVFRRIRHQRNHANIE